MEKPEARGIGRNRFRIIPFACFLALQGFSLGADPAWDMGKDAFVHDRPAEAILYLEQATAADPGNYLAWLYLGIAAQQAGKYDVSVRAFQSALDRNLGEPQVLLFNMGNTWALSGDSDKAAGAYRSAIQTAPSFGKPRINLGNLQVRQTLFPEAIQTYKEFLSVLPGDPMVPDVVRMIALLEEEIKAREDAAKAEEARLVAEKARKEEEARLLKEKEEAARKAEEKRKQMMDDLFNNLDDLAGSGNTLSAGNEDVLNTTDTMDREE